MSSTKNKLAKTIGVLSLCLVTSTSFSDAHSGRTDSNGGHRDNKNKSGLGSYHYHCGGYPAHLHTNGCPYGGGSSSSSSSSNSSNSSNSSSSNTTSSSNQASIEKQKEREKEQVSSKTFNEMYTSVFGKMPITESKEENSENYHILKSLESAFNVENLSEIAKKNEFVKLSENAFLNQDLEFIWPSLDGEFISDNGTCHGLRNQVAILVNGNVVPCCLDGEGCINLGNIFNESFENIINSEYSKEFIKAFEENRVFHSLCKRCGFRGKFDK